MHPSIVPILPSLILYYYKPKHFHHLPLILLSIILLHHPIMKANNEYYLMHSEPKVVFDSNQVIFLFLRRLIINCPTSSVWIPYLNKHHNFYHSALLTYHSIIKLLLFNLILKGILLSKNNCNNLMDEG